MVSAFLPPLNIHMHGMSCVFALRTCLHEPNPSCRQADPCTTKSAGLYKQLATLKELLTEYREDPAPSSPLKGPILDALSTSGLYEDCPFEEGAKDGKPLTAEDADSVDDEVSEADRGLCGRQTCK